MSVRVGMPCSVYTSARAHAVLSCVFIGCAHTHRGRGACVFSPRTSFSNDVCATAFSPRSSFLLLFPLPPLPGTTDVEQGLQNIKDVDEVLAYLAASVHVDIMPGANDPSNVAVPQQPLHHCMFPRAASKATLMGVTNPYRFSVDGVELLGTSGQGVDDIFRFTAADDEGTRYVRMYAVVVVVVELVW